jgi:hypothetical protein
VERVLVGQSTPSVIGPRELETDVGDGDVVGSMLGSPGCRPAWHSCGPYGGENNPKQVAIGQSARCAGAVALTCGNVAELLRIAVGKSGTRPSHSAGLEEQQGKESQ